MLRKCPFCAEEIQAEAIKCKHCQEYLTDRNSSTKWYHQPFAIVFLFLCLGPFALPVVWKNPKISQRSKIIISVIMGVLTIIIVIAVVWAIKVIANYYQQIFGSLNSNLSFLVY